jgi:nucleotide-binding universal stress UspA family protein
LIPVDLSHEAWQALPLARVLGDLLPAAIVPLYVDATEAPDLGGSAEPVVIRTVVDGLPVAVQVLGGSEVAGVITDRIDRGPGSVVVMSTHGHSNHPDRGWGDVCDKLLMARAASLFLVGPHFDPVRNATITQVAACIDAAAPDHELVADALGWADRLEVPLVVLTVKGQGRERPGDDETYHVMAAVFDQLPPAKVSVTAQALEDIDPAPAIIRFAERRAGTLLALAPGAAPRAVHAVTHSVTMAVARETTSPLLARWHRPDEL